MKKNICYFNISERINSICKNSIHKKRIKILKKINKECYYKSKYEKHSDEIISEIIRTCFYKNDMMFCDKQEKIYNKTFSELYKFYYFINNGIIKCDIFVNICVNILTLTQESFCTTNIIDYIDICEYKTSIKKQIKQMILESFPDNIPKNRFRKYIDGYKFMKINKLWNLFSLIINLKYNIKT